MKYLVALLLLLPMVATADSEPANWTDGAGLSWTYQTNRSRFSKAKDNCAELGLRLPVEEEFYDAINF